MMNEVAKLAVFVGDKKGIEEDDVDQATAGQRSFQAYDLDDALAAADFAKGAAILNELFAEGERSEVIVGRLAGFFRNVLAAQTWLREKSRTKDEIFQTFFPYISKELGRPLPGEIRELLRRRRRTLAGRAQRPPGEAPSARPDDQDDELHGRRREDPVRDVPEGILPGEKEEDDYFAVVGLRSATCRLSRDL